MRAITISRQYGSGGRKIAAHVSELLGFKFFDKWLISRIASEVWLPSDDIVDFSELHYKGKTFMENLRVILGRPHVAVAEAPVHGDALFNMRKMDETAAVSLVNAAIVAAYKNGDVVIVGRGGQMVLQDKPDVLHVRIEAPLATRIERLQVLENISAQQARLVVEAHDRSDAEYMRRCHGGRCDDPMLYHMVINTGKCPLPTAARLIVDAAKHLKVEALPAAVVD